MIIAGGASDATISTIESEARSLLQGALSDTDPAEHRWTWSTDQTGDELKSVSSSGAVIA